MPDRLLCWAETITGMELDDDGRIHTLDGKTWQERNKRLAKQDGHPSR